MKNKKFAATLLGLAAGTCLFAGELGAWEKKTDGTCIMEDNESSFMSELSPYGNKKYQNLTPDQRKMAMDMADKNRMSPDDAVIEMSAKASKK